MPLFVLDTDHISLIQRGHSHVVARVNTTPTDDIAVSVVTYEEQLRGRLDVIRQATNVTRLSVAYLRLREMQEFFCAIRMLDFSAEAAHIYEQLRRQHRTLGTMDLRIAATALATRGTLVTRNTRDFARLAKLSLEDWSVP
jgi:tRNA(fMet)-specific endonuclease VapC